MKKVSLLFLFLAFLGVFQLNAQLFKLPDPKVINLRSSIGRTVGVTDIAIQYGSPAVRGREGSIWGTNVVAYGYTVLGFGSNVESPWRAGADEGTTMSFSTDVTINGQKLAAGKYGFFIAVYPDSSVLIFNKNTHGWGSYFYDKAQDVLHVATKLQKNQPLSKERLDYTFSNQTDHSVEVALEWERWRIPFNVEVDIVNTTLTSIRSQMSGSMGFDPASLQAAANWCLQNNNNLNEAMNWINSATNPNLGGVETFSALSTKSGLLSKLGKKDEADKAMKTALENASALELHCTTSHPIL